MSEGEEMTTCWCPKCECFHEMKLHWIGRGMPRIYCRPCKHTQELNMELIYPVPKFDGQQEGVC